MANKKDSNVQEEQNVETSASVETNVVSEVQPALTVEEKQPSFFEKNKAVIIIAGIAVIGIVLLILVISLISSLFGSKTVENPLVYVTSSGDLKYITSNKKEGVVIEDDFDSSLDVVYSNTSNKYILYTKDDNLYLINTKKKVEPEKIVSDVDEFMFNENDKYIVFTDEDGDLYSYNFKDKEKLESEVTSIRAVSGDKVFYKKDGNLYMRSLKASKNDKEKIAADYKYAYFNEDMTKILYSKENNDDLYDYYVYNVKSKKDEKVISDAYTVYSYNDDFTKFIYGVNNEGATFDLSKIVEDDMKEADADFKEYTYEDYSEGLVDYSTYLASRSEKRAIENRNDIREQLEEEYELGDTIDVYYQAGSKKTKIAEEVTSVEYADADTKRVVYSKTTYDTSNKIKLSDVSYFSKIKTHLRTCAKNTVLFKVGEKEAVEMLVDATDLPDVYVINNDLYYLDSEDELFYSKISGNKLSDAQSLAEDVKVLDSMGTYKDSLVFATDVKSSVGDLKVSKAGKVTNVDSDVYTKQITIADTDKIYYYTDYEDNSGDFNVFSGKPKTILTDVGYVYYVRDNFMYVFKDYSSKLRTYDLYRYKGSKLQLIEYEVSEVY